MEKTKTEPKIASNDFITFRSQMAALKCKARKTSNHNQVYHSDLLVKKKLFD